MSEKKLTTRQVGAMVDRLYKAREARLKLQRQVDDLKRDEYDALEAVKAALREIGTEGASGKIARFERKRPKIVPIIQDWDAFRKYVTRNKAWEMLQKRVNTAAIRERLEDGKKVAGVETIEVFDYGLHKR